MQIAQSLGVTEADIQRELVGPTQKGPGNWEWVQAILRAIDRIPGVSSKAVDLFTRDVFVYLTLPGVRRKIDRVVDEALGAEPCVVVAHSLGTVVAYNVLRRRGTGGLVCPRFVTLGSPLGVKAIKDRLDTPLESPPAVGNWFNAYDERDLVALVGLDQLYFNVIPAIVNKSDVRNFTDNRHGVEGYLSDPVIAAKLSELL
jgi:pimeloyl-ACP methyl ester carboxylesterase